MAEIITRDSDEFKELAGWMKRIGRSLEDATARMRPTIADEHYLQGEEVCELLHVSKRTLQTLRDEGGGTLYNHRWKDALPRKRAV